MRINTFINIVLFLSSTFLAFFAANNIHYVNSQSVKYQEEEYDVVGVIDSTSFRTSNNRIVELACIRAIKQNDRIVEEFSEILGNKVRGIPLRKTRSHLYLLVKTDRSEWSLNDYLVKEGRAYVPKNEQTIPFYCREIHSRLRAFQEDAQKQNQGYWRDN